jgi:DNA-binding HxlR family transcriptional regulator
VAETVATTEAQAAPGTVAAPVAPTAVVAPAEVAAPQAATEADPCGAPEFDVFARACPSRPVLEHLTGRWGVLVLAGLHAGPVRFNALRRRIDGISEKMLSQTLQSLERDGLVEREVQAVMPPKVEYRLSSLGTDIATKLLDLVESLEARMPEILEAQSQYDDESGLGPFTVREIRR